MSIRGTGMCNVPVMKRICRESYNDPREVYETLKWRGMNLVTVTDHDSIDAAEELRGHPDFFLSEEVTCTTPSGTEIHVGAYGIEEPDQAELQRRQERCLSSLTGRRTDLDFLLFEELFQAVEHSMDKSQRRITQPRPCWHAIGERPWWVAAMPITVAALGSKLYRRAFRRLHLHLPAGPPARTRTHARGVRELFQVDARRG